MHSEEGAPNGQLVSTICGPDKKMQAGCVRAQDL